MDKVRLQSTEKRPIYTGMLCMRRPPATAGSNIPAEGIELITGQTADGVLWINGRSVTLREFERGYSLVQVDRHNPSSEVVKKS